MKQTRIVLTSLITLVVLITGCGSTNTPTSNSTTTEVVETTASISSEVTENSAKFVLITAEEGKKMLEEDTSIVLVDVREPDEYAAAHIPGSILLPLGTIAEKVSDVIPDKNTPIILYCRSGRRSAMGAEELVQMGYTTVYDMGGILNWPYETESGMTSP
jgi:phage shock protein E